MSRSAKKPSPRAVQSNWKNSCAPFLKKVRMALRNNWIKIRTGKSCCGNYGQVGC